MSEFGKFPIIIVYSLGRLFLLGAEISSKDSGQCILINKEIKENVPGRDIINKYMDTEKIN